MTTFSYPYTFHDLLCLRQFNEIHGALHTEASDKEIVEWAEHQVMQGNDSEAVLILASLNLDKHPNSDEVRMYLDRYLLESGQSLPDAKISALIWLKLQLLNIIQCEDAKKAETVLYDFAIAYLDFPPPFFTRTCRYFNWLYYRLYDDLGGEYQTLASEMSDSALLSYIKSHTTPFYRVLSDNEWLDFLTSE
ncbi:hypothetical protein [Enterobacter sp. 638]|uniref:Uncharacterized protein n=1 Tax=Enterobacter sp. (strain 638) TaxID=399742 RepID=A0A9J9GIU4_ENT38|nr:hypothetical protein [Enterobacter sp. 638]ABP62179.1 hypothetical protein Ent638_3521 [Enterobacter sp. 638]